MFWLKQAFIKGQKSLIIQTRKERPVCVVFVMHVDDRNESVDYTGAWQLQSTAWQRCWAPPLTFAPLSLENAV